MQNTPISRTSICIPKECPALSYKPTSPSMPALALTLSIDLFLCRELRYAIAKVYNVDNATNTV